MDFLVMDRFAPVVVRKILVWQLVLAVAIFLLLLGVNRELAYSALAGGVIAILANLYSAKRVFAPYRAQQPEELLKRFYGTEIKKIVLTICMFAGAIAWMEPLSIPAMFGSYFAVHLVPLVVASFN